jgi:hypothetical protein
MEQSPVPGHHGPTQHDSLTEENVQTLEQDQAAVSPTCLIDANPCCANDLQQGLTQTSFAETCRYNDGIKDFAKESLFNLAPTMRERSKHKRISDSSADYSEYFKEADEARQLVGTDCQLSLKQFRESQTTETPYERWRNSSTTGWPDQAAVLGANRDDRQTSGPTVTSATTDRGLRLPTIEQDTTEFDKGEGDDRKSRKELLERVKERNRTLKPGSFRVPRETEFRIRKGCARRRRR